MFNREQAPISAKAWEEIDERAGKVLKSYLSARKVVKVNGPYGLSFNAISEGRLTDVEEAGALCCGVYKVQPLTEVKVEFEMDRCELNNIDRGARDIDFEPLEEAAKNIALFEENAVFNGLEKASIVGIKNSVKHDAIPFGKDQTEIMEAISKGLITLRKSYQEGPYDLVVSDKVYTRIMAADGEYPLDEKIEDLIGGKIVFNHVIDGAYLLPHDHDDLEFTIGQDFAIGYKCHIADKIKFFIKESFTFRVLDPTLIVKFNLD